MSRKFILKLFLALLPFVLYLCIFVVNEPYNYWGIKAEKSGLWATPLARVRAFMREPSDNIFIGDSRMYHFNRDAIFEEYGLDYGNLSTGGQALNLSRELYDWAKTKVNVKSVIMDASFYQLENGTSSPSAAQVFIIAEHPLDYLVTRDYVCEAFGIFIDSFLNKKAENSGTDETRYIGKYRKDLVDYTVDQIVPNCVNYTISQDRLRDALYIADDVKIHGGTVKVVLPPVQEVIWEYAIEPQGVDRYMPEYKEVLSQHALLYDGEWKSDFALNQDIYVDGFHFWLLDGCERFQRAIFENDSSIFRISGE